jgi:hypothetical protein
MIAGKVELLPGATHDIEVEFPRTGHAQAHPALRTRRRVTLQVDTSPQQQGNWVYQDQANAIHINRNGEFYGLGRFVSPTV